MPQPLSIQPGAESSEYRLSLWSIASSTLLGLGAMGLVALDRLSLEGLLVVLGIVLGGSIGPAIVASRYAGERGATKREAIRGNTDVAVAEVTKTPVRSLSSSGGAP